MKKLTLIFSLLISLNSLAQMSWLDSSNNSSSEKLKTIIKKYPDLNLKIGDAKIISKLQFISPGDKRIQSNLLWVSHNRYRVGYYGGMQEALIMEGFRVTNFQTEYRDYNVLGNVANKYTTFGGANYMTHTSKNKVYIFGGTNWELFMTVVVSKKPSEKIKRVILRKIKNGDY